MVQFTSSSPGANEVLSVSQGRMKDNFNYVYNSFGKNHINATNDTDPTAGYHNIAQFFNQSADPSVVAGSGQLYTKTTGTPADQQLFYMTGSGTVIPLTSTEAESSNGYVVVAGVIIQWGSIAQNSSTTNTVNLATAPNIVFPNNIFSAQATPTRTSSSSPGSEFVYFIDTSSLSTAGFNIINRTTHSYGWTWIAIGN